MAKTKTAKKVITVDTGKNLYFWNGKVFEIRKSRKDYSIPEADQAKQNTAAKNWLQENNWLPSLKPVLQELPK